MRELVSSLFETNCDVIGSFVISNWVKSAVEGMGGMPRLSVYTTLVGSHVSAPFTPRLAIRSKVGKTVKQKSELEMSDS